MTEVVGQEKKSLTIINILSVAIPLVVAILLGLPKKADLGAWTKTLPHFIGAVNTLTSLALILGFIFIKRGKINLHRAMMTTAFLLGILFLIFYVTYHLTNPATPFGGQGFIRPIYYFILISHILLSLIVLPLVLRAMFFAVTNQFDRHKKTARFAYPIWLYVSVTGVLSYLLISPYYN